MVGGASSGLRLDWQANERDVVTFDGGYIRSAAGRKDFRPIVASPFVITNVETETSDAGHALTRWRHEESKDSSWVLQTYWDHVARKGDQGYIDIRWDTFDVDFQHQLLLGDRQKIVYGANYRYVDMFLNGSKPDGGFQLSFADARRHRNLFSAFAQDQITLFEDRLILTLGSKFEHNDFTGFEIQPNGRLLWMPTKRQTVWTAVSRAVRTPFVTEHDVAATTLQAEAGTGAYPRTTGNSAFVSEELLASELGYRTQATDKLSIDIALFYNVYDNLKVFVPGPTFSDSFGATILPLVIQNGMFGKTYGVEVAETWQPTGWWRLYGAYTFLQMQLHSDLALVQSQVIGTEGRSPNHQVYLRSSWDLPRHVEFDLMGRFVGQLNGFNAGTPTASIPNVINSHISLNARLAWRPSKKLEIAVVGENLLDTHHPESGTSTALRAPLVEIERSVYGKLTWGF